MGWEEDRMEETRREDARMRRLMEEENRRTREDIARWENERRSCDSVNNQTSSYQDPVQQSYTDQAWQNQCWQNKAAADEAQLQATADERYRQMRAEQEQRERDWDNLQRQQQDAAREYQDYLDTQDRIQHDVYIESKLLDSIRESQLAIDRQLEKAREDAASAQRAWEASQFEPVPLVPLVH